MLVMGTEENGAQASPICLHCGRVIPRPRQRNSHKPVPYKTYLRRRFCSGACAGAWLRWSRQQASSRQETVFHGPASGPLMVEVTNCPKCHNPCLEQSYIGKSCPLCGTQVLVRDGDWRQEVLVYYSSHPDPSQW